MLELKFSAIAKPGRKKLMHAVLWSTFINGLLASLISLPAILSTTSEPIRLLPAIYLILQQLGHFQFFAFLLCIPLLFIALITPHQRLLQILTIVFFSAFITLVFIDYSVFRLYRFHLNGMVWNMLTGGALEEIFVFDRANILSAGSFIAVILLTQIFIQWLVARRTRRQLGTGTGWKIFASVLLIQLLGQSFYAWADAWYKTDIMQMVRFAPLAQPITIKSFLRKHNWAPDIPQHAAIGSKNNGHFKYPLQPMQCSAPPQKTNILFIISDSLRFDMLNPQVMPHWSEMARQSQQFKRHISSGNATRFGIFGLFSGLYGNYWFDALNTETSSVLIDQLKTQGYRFGLFANAPLTSPEFDKTIFSSIRSSIPDKTPGANVIEREIEINRQAKQFLQQKNNQPFFGLIFYDAPHAYVSPPQDNVFQPALKELNYLKLNNHTDAAPFLNRYKNAVHFNDRLSGEIFESLKKQGLMKNTIIIMTGDHGQEANETHSNSWGHNSNFSRYQVQVPLLIYWPGMLPRQYNHLTSHVDVVPTLLKSVFSCNNPLTDYSNGQSLFDEQARDFVPVKNWSNQAMVNAEQVRVYPKIGPVEHHDFNTYQTLETDNLSPSSDKQLIEAISRFYQ